MRFNFLKKSIDESVNTISSDSSYEDIQNLQKILQSTQEELRYVTDKNNNKELLWQDWENIKNIKNTCIEQEHLIHTLKKDSLELINYKNNFENILEKYNTIKKYEILHDSNVKHDWRNSSEGDIEYILFCMNCKTLRGNLKYCQCKSTIDTVDFGMRGYLLDGNWVLNELSLKILTELLNYTSWAVNENGSYLHAYDKKSFDWIHLYNIVELKTPIYDEKNNEYIKWAISISNADEPGCIQLMNTRKCIFSKYKCNILKYSNQLY